jgi:hypothetical protein
VRGIPYYGTCNRDTGTMGDVRVPAELDLLIAATARASGLVVATLNVRHFQGMEGVAVEDWSRQARTEQPSVVARARAARATCIDEY